MSNVPPWEDGLDNLPPVDTYDRMTNSGPNKPKAGDSLHTINGYIIRETEKAILIEVWQVNGKDIETPDDATKRNMWFPLSQVSTIHRDNGSDGAYDYIRAKEWICKQKDLL